MIKNVLLIAIAFAFAPVATFAQTATPTPGASASSGSTSSCITPNAEVRVVTAVSPVLPDVGREQLPHGLTSVRVLVTVDASGHVVNAAIAKSSAVMSVDQAAIRAASKSTYTPKVVNCEPTQGQYMFSASFEVE